MFGLIIIKEKTLDSLQEQLSITKTNLGKKIQHIQTLTTEIELLKVKNQEMYQKIHCKPHDKKGYFCKKEDAVNGSTN